MDVDGPDPLRQRRRTREPLNKGRETPVPPGFLPGRERLSVPWSKGQHCSRAETGKKLITEVELTVKDSCRQLYTQAHGGKGGTTRLELWMGDRGGVFLYDPVTKRTARIPWMHEWKKGRHEGKIRTPYTLKVLPREDVENEKRRRTEYRERKYAPREEEESVPDIESFLAALDREELPPAPRPLGFGQTPPPPPPSSFQGPGQQLMPGVFINPTREERRVIQEQRLQAAKRKNEQVERDVEENEMEESEERKYIIRGKRRRDEPSSSSSSYTPPPNVYFDSGIRGMGFQQPSLVQEEEEKVDILTVDEQVDWESFLNPNSNLLI